MLSGLLTNILKLPMSFHDSTPTGRLLNRFARDTEAGTAVPLFPDLRHVSAGGRRWQTMLDHD